MNNLNTIEDMISPLASVSPNAKIGKNVSILPFAYIEDGVVIGDDCVVMSHASVLKGTVMGNGNKVYQNAVLGAEPQDFHYKGGDTRLVIGTNNTFRENVVVSRGSHAEGATTIGNGNFLMDKVHVCHDVTVGNNCVFGIGVSVAGESVFDESVILSSGVIVHQGCHVGKWSLVQSGSVLSKDVPPYIIVAGNPPSYHGVNAVVMEHSLKTSDKVLRHIVNAYRLLSQSNFSVVDAVQKIGDQVPMSDEIRDILDFVKNAKKDIVR